VAPTDWLQTIGSASIAGMSATLYYVATRPLWTDRSRAALAVVATFLAAAVLARLLAQVGLLSQVEARIANGLMALAFLGVLLFTLRHDRKAGDP